MNAIRVETTVASDGEPHLSELPCQHGDKVGAWSVAEVCTRDRRQTVTALLAATTLVCCGLLSWRQLGYWRDSETLWRHALAATTNNYGTHTMLAKTLLDKRMFPEAVKHFEASLRLMPDNGANHGILAVALGMLGQLDEAATHLERSLQLRPDHAFTHFKNAG